MKPLPGNSKPPSAYPWGECRGKVEAHLPRAQGLKSRGRGTRPWHRKRQTDRQTDKQTSKLSAHYHTCKFQDEILSKKIFKRHNVGEKTLESEAKLPNDNHACYAAVQRGRITGFARPYVCLVTRKRKGVQTPKLARMFPTVRIIDVPVLFSSKGQRSRLRLRLWLSVQLVSKYTSSLLIMSIKHNANKYMFRFFMFYVEHLLR